MPRFTVDDFQGPEGGYLVGTHRDGDWRFRPVMGQAELSPDEAEALGLYAQTAPAQESEGVPLIDDVRLPLANLSKAWYEATRVFGRYNIHPDRAEDWNLETGGNSDLGEPLVAPFNGLVIAAAQYGGTTGRVIQILGVMPDGVMVVWCGWHLQDVLVAPGQIVRAGDEVGSIGNAEGVYSAHLHEQIAVIDTRWGIPGPTVFASNSSYNWQQPSQWYREHGVPDDVVDRVTKRDGR